MRVTILDMEISACPTLWNCEVDGKPGYIRYRWGYISIRLDEGHGFNNPEVLGERIGDGFDGTLSEEQLFEWLNKHNVEFDF